MTALRVWFGTALETAATFWRVLRRDGVALGFTTHDRDLWIDGVLHRATPGMVPSAIRRSADLEADSAEVRGALSHDSILPEDLSAGRFDGAQVLIGLVDWDSADSRVLYRGAIGTVSEEAGGFTAQLQSRKAELMRDPVPRTSPSCRAEFCGPGCTLSPARFSHDAAVASVDLAGNSIQFTPAVAAGLLVSGSLRWFDGPHAGLTMQIVAAYDGGVMLDTPLDPAAASGCRIELREGCDRTVETCASRFGNAINFQGEPFLPGNDLIVRYPSPVQ